MTELKFINNNGRQDGPACCETSRQAKKAYGSLSPQSGVPGPEVNQAGWVVGSLMTEVGPVWKVSTCLALSDLWEHFKCRISAFRNSYLVIPGLYAVGTPDKNSDVLVSANYKLSFDALRKTLKGLDVWVLVLDTKGINVWCAAGKGTFGTEELLSRIATTRLDKVVDHRRIIVPQLGAPGISAHKVGKASGFRVNYGPVRAEDIRAYIAEGYHATKEMRTVDFPVIDRLVLTPMEINPAMKKYYPWYALAMLAFFGLQPGGILFREALLGSLPFLLFGLISVLAGAFITPVLLPFIPFRSFAVKGWLAGILSIIVVLKTTALLSLTNTFLLVFSYLFFPLASSYIALQFTGSTTFTGMSGVKKELKISIPLYIGGSLVSLVLLIVYKLGEWRII